MGFGRRLLLPGRRAPRTTARRAATRSYSPPPTLLLPRKGGFYNVAPWPVGSKQKAAKYLGEGAAIAPTRRNLYYAGVNVGAPTNSSKFLARPPPPPLAA